LTSKKLVGNLKPEFVLKRCQKLEKYLNSKIINKNINKHKYKQKHKQTIALSALPLMYEKQAFQQFIQQELIPTKTSTIRRIPSKTQAVGTTSNEILSVRKEKKERKKERKKEK